MQEGSSKAKSEKPLDNIQEIWTEVLVELKKIVSKPSFENWLKNTNVLRIEFDTIIVATPNEFARD
ncbi:MULTISPECIES: DnaA N-terminal domain-containing protein [Bacillus]|uniref:DnaA N-terminal domain-containing protein n=1 Tax=Bacillus TaxID=1386 RepID=UPI0003160388|nr:MULTISPECIES: DnaA N-terminal domain-containing protein [Bacillus]